MPKHDFQLTALVRSLDYGLFLGEALFYPEVSRLAESGLRARRALALNVVTLAEQTPHAALHRRVAPANLERTSFSLQLPPPRDVPQWKQPLELNLQAAIYRHGNHHVAIVPDLGIEVIAPDREQLLARLPLECLSVLRRRLAAENLALLAQQLRGSGFEIESATIKLDVPTPREAARRAANGKAGESVLKEVADDLRAARLSPAWCMEVLVAKMAEVLGNRTPASVLLVGPPGVGKTAAMHELVRRSAELALGQTPFFATSGSRLVAGMTGFGMWQERCNRLRLEAARQRAILHLGSLVELMEVGKGMMIQQGVAGFLRPYIARGELLCIAECTPDQLPVIERNDPHLLGAFARIDVQEPPPQDCAQILRQAADKRPVTPAALDTLSRLHRRYATYSAWPGRPLRFLANLLADRAQGEVGPADVYGAFARETGLPLAILDDSAPMNLAQIQAFFEARVIGQGGAMELVLDLLATIKAGLARPHKPLASLLFVGPTGVGKTETAKALAEFLFSDRKRMTRFDMSEYQSPSAVARLIGGAQGEGLLTARVREQPFAVLLFDEFEKAHPQFFDLLLQVLGEARLTDSAGRLADFGNTVIIMTSNLGAESFLDGRIGFGAGSTGAVNHFTSKLREFVRPELMNRIDRVVPFLPLPPQAVKQVLHKELAQLATRPGLHETGCSLTLQDAAQDWLVARAYQPDLGARPLKREIERALLVPLSELLNTHQAQAAQVTAGVSGQSIALHVQRDATPASLARDPGLSRLAMECVRLRRKTQSADRAPAVAEIRNDIYRIRKLMEDQERAARKRNKPLRRSPEAERELRRLPALESAQSALASLAEHLAALEDDLLLAAAGREMPDLTALSTRLAKAETDWQAALRRMMRLRFAAPDQCTLFLACSNHDLLFDLGRAYADFALRAGLQLGAVWFSHDAPQDDLRDMARRAENESDCRLSTEQWAARARARMPQRIVAQNAHKFLTQVREEPGTLALHFRGPDAMLMLHAEQGQHLFKPDAEASPLSLVVSISPQPPMEAEPPEGTDAALRRSYALHTRQAQDALLGEVLAWTGARLDTVISRGVEGAFSRALEAQVGL